YMKTAIAKGLSYNRALIKYPVRIALIPFVATVGWALPGLISGQTILAIVMDLPTVAPLLNAALRNQDMYLGASIIMILGALTMIGTLLSDIILAIVDPRVRSSL
ncbi:MAG: ABC transporter permease subunit, partial [Treponema sp.]|nr:ABC transporter permease subunit [Treponema sp.]